MNEQTKLELLKIAAQLTTAYASSNGNKSVDSIKSFYRDYSEFVFDHYNSLSSEINQNETPAT